MKETDVQNYKLECRFRAYASVNGYTSEEAFLKDVKDNIPEAQNLKFDSEKGVLSGEYRTEVLAKNAKEALNIADSVFFMETNEISTFRFPSHSTFLFSEPLHTKTTEGFEDRTVLETFYIRPERQLAETESSLDFPMIVEMSNQGFRIACMGIYESHSLTKDIETLEQTVCACGEDVVVIHKSDTLDKLYQELTGDSVPMKWLSFDKGHLSDTPDYASTKKYFGQEASDKISHMYECQRPVLSAEDCLNVMSHMRNLIVAREYDEVKLIEGFDTIRSENPKQQAYTIQNDANGEVSLAFRIQITDSDETPLHICDKEGERAVMQMLTRTNLPIPKTDEEFIQWKPELTAIQNIAAFSPIQAELVVHKDGKELSAPVPLSRLEARALKSSLEAAIDKSMDNIFYEYDVQRFETELNDMKVGDILYASKDTVKVSLELPKPVMENMVMFEGKEAIRQIDTHEVKAVFTVTPTETELELITVPKAGENEYRLSVATGSALEEALINKAEEIGHISFEDIMLAEGVIQKKETRQEEKV